MVTITPSLSYAYKCWNTEGKHYLNALSYSSDYRMTGGRYPEVWSPFFHRQMDTLATMSMAQEDEEMNQWNN